MTETLKAEFLKQFARLSKEERAKLIRDIETVSLGADCFSACAKARAARA